MIWLVSIPMTWKQSAWTGKFLLLRQQINMHTKRACLYNRNSIVTPSISNQTFSLAVYYYKKADYFGLVAATYRLGYIFEYGHLHTEVNIWEAYKYYTRAAEKNHEDAMLELSRLYKEGVPKCLEPSPQNAYQWCLKATENGNEVAEYVMG